MTFLFVSCLQKVSLMGIVIHIEKCKKVSALNSYKIQISFLHHCFLVLSLFSLPLSLSLSLSLHLLKYFTLSL